MKSLLYATTALGALALTAPANATLQLAIDINGALFTCADQAACDNNPLVGQLGTGNVTIGGVSFLGSSQTQLTGGTNELTTTSFQITNGTLAGVAYQFAVSGTDFQGPVTDVVQSGSGTFTNAAGSSIDLSYFADHANTQGAAQNASGPTDTPGVLLSDSGVINAITTSQSISYDHTDPFANLGLYSMSMGASGNLVAGGQLTGRAQSELAVNAVEPGSLAMFGVGLLCLGFIANQKRRS